MLLSLLNNHSNVIEEYFDLSASQYSLLIISKPSEGVAEQREKKAAGREGGEEKQWEEEQGGLSLECSCFPLNPSVLSAQCHTRNNSWSPF